MEQKKTCEICNRLYKTIPLKLPGSASKLDTNSIRITFRLPNKAGILNYDICPGCTSQLMWHIKTMKRNAPKKCEFCQFDHGPLRETPPECKDCIKYSNFQLKKRMSEIEEIRWKHFNGDLNNSPKAINEILKRY